MMHATHTHTHTHSGLALVCALWCALCARSRLLRSDYNHLLPVEFGHLLEAEYLLRRHYPYEILGPLSSTFRACFHRWQAYVQLRVTRRGLSEVR